ncbi:hypothetical protein K440DRAFT_271618 [Wilcoxina mikolae CBS 423.85]|nr:hypothetical protein K440DRAFT_271618 [Wilcoxina mikolae CBS 423.85]
MLSRATWKLTTLVIRLLQAVLSFVALAVFIHLLTMPFSNTPRTELIVLLVVTILTLLQTLSASIFTFLSREALWVAGIDLLCICGSVTSVVMSRGVAERYGCKWQVENTGSSSPGGIMERRGEGGMEQCIHLKGVFGIGIVQRYVL